MGFITQVSISNDFFNEHLKDPEAFVRAIQEGMNDRWEENSDASARRHYVTVHGAQHADTPQIIWSYHNLSLPIHEMPWAVAKGEVPIPFEKTLRSAILDMRNMADRLEAELDKKEED